MSEEKMLNTLIKEQTHTAHQQLEKQVVLRLKTIRNESDYAALLKHFYVYFSAVEQAIAPYITPEVLPDYAERRNSSYIRQDIEALGGTADTLPSVTVPVITNALEALSALYVLEGSIMGGPYIVQMLQKQGLTKGFSFFSGYGADTGRMWGAFTAVLNAHAHTSADREQAVATANETFSRFGEVFEQAGIRNAS